MQLETNLQYVGSSNTIFCISFSPSFVNKNIKEVDIPKNVRVGAILRDDKIIIPNSKTIFKIGDDVVFYSEISSIKKLEKLLAILP